MSFQDLRLQIYTRWSLSPAMLLHLKLLTQMVGHFYDAKQREQAQRQSAYTQAIYETGARLTHDVKNLLQSLRSLCAAVETSTTPTQAPALQALMQRQLPQITQRLNVTLDKLQRAAAGGREPGGCRDLVGAPRQRYSNAQRPASALDGAVAGREAARGALRQRRRQSHRERAQQGGTRGAPLEVRVTFSPARRGTLTVCDTGAAIGEGIAAQLFEGAVSSHTGLGVGLYQSARLAAQSGYRLALAANLPRAGLLRAVGPGRRGRVRRRKAGWPDRRSGQLTRGDHAADQDRHRYPGHDVVEFVARRSPERTRLTKMRSALPPFGFGFCASSMLVPPVAALGPTDQITTGAVETSVGAVPQCAPGETPLPLAQT